MKITSQSLGLPTQKFSRDHVVKLDHMDNGSLENLLAKQKSLLVRKHLLPDGGVKLEEAIKRAEAVLEKRKETSDKFSAEFDRLKIAEPKFPVCGKRQFSPCETKQTARISVLPILSFEESEKALKACEIKVGSENLEIIDKCQYRDPSYNNQVDYDSDDSKSENELLDSDDD